MVHFGIVHLAGTPFSLASAPFLIDQAPLLREVPTNFHKIELPPNPCRALFVGGDVREEEEEMFARRRIKHMGDA